MCGIAGFCDFSRLLSNEQILSIGKEMTDTLEHRGPDDEGIWFEDNTRLLLGQRRLSIVDLSPEGHQPMHSTSERYVIVFNGEIYNFTELRQALVGKYRFRGHSDTEVMLAAIEEWGIEKAVTAFVGMFSFALWDRREHILTLARDRIGEKPLYYGWSGGTFFFASELKALRAHPSFQNVIDRDVLSLYLRHNYIPAPYSIYNNVYKLIPGTILTLDCKLASPETVTKTYWSAKEMAEEGCRNPFEGTEQEAVDTLERLLKCSIKNQMVADVPLGAFLSGGIDSSTVVALMQAQSNIPIKTFSIGFYEDKYNEATYAKDVAQHLKTDHTELYVTSEEARNVILRLPLLYDEPFSDSSQIPTFLVASLARKKVTVSLSGDAGDELFGGYNRYLLGKNIWDKIGHVPRNVRKHISAGIIALPSKYWDALFTSMKSIISDKWQPSGYRMHTLAELLAAPSIEALYRVLISHWKSPSSIVRGSCEKETAFTNKAIWASLDDFIQRMMYLDTVTYLPDDILVKVDRACMGVSLESRVPFLDHRIVEFAWRIPMKMKIRNGQGKWLLRQVLYNYVPKELIERPKMGFGIPLDSWLRGSLKDWADSLLESSRLQQEGFFDPQPIQKKWREHLAGTHNWQYYLWDILMFQAWLEHENKF